MSGSRLIMIISIIMHLQHTAYWCVCVCVVVSVCVCACGRRLTARVHTTFSGCLAAAFRPKTKKKRSCEKKNCPVGKQNEINKRQNALREIGKVALKYAEIFLALKKDFPVKDLN